MRVLVVGSGGREHALAWKLKQSPRLEALHAAPGNPGIARIGQCHPAHAEDAESLLALCHELEIDLAVVGPEAPLVAGLADTLRHAGIAVFGPSAAAARIEGSKTFAKDVLEAAGVPTAARLSVARPPCVVKADGLAAGKGVFVCRTQEELDAGLRAAAALGEDVVIEELLEGEEVSLLVLTDGREAVPLAPAQDFKRIGDGNSGPNTGGMGSYSPVAGLGDAEVEELVDTVHRPVLAELAHRGAPFAGVLYAGLMLTDDGPKVLEFNCRFGDPETQSILPRLEGDLLEALEGVAGGRLDGSVAAGDRAAVTLVLASGAYPERSDDRGTPIGGVEEAESTGALVFHAGTARHGEQLVTNGGRILNVTAVGDDLPAARAAAYDAADRISFAGLQYRSDIALAAAEGHVRS
ncbi:MAG: phosphoribosylamine--glycine ligase [Actinobacteria bacterium]|nr:MAG: phosphoribosylamine--glycine ligase [Actinomycetota bacterium]